MQFSIGHVLALADKTVFNPFVTIAIPLYLHYFTEDKLVVDRTNTWLRYSIRTPLPPLIYKSIVIVVIGLALRLNRYLSTKALNNGRAANFNWDREIVVVTGGSGGIGAQAVKKLAARGSKVVVIDVIPLTFEAREIHIDRTWGCLLTQSNSKQRALLQVRFDRLQGTTSCFQGNRKVGGVLIAGTRSAKRMIETWVRRHAW